MIRVKFQKDPKTGALKMSVRGHANAADAGQDLVCAAASILAFTVAQDVTDAYRDGRLIKPPKIKLQHGRTMIETQPKPEAYAEILHTLFIIQKGFIVLAVNNPEFVRVSPFVIEDDTRDGAIR